ncbi:MAG: hypothetical protein CO128_07690 [Ignavibacteriales bacterium CG_4_9_14_3_um_filter_30_11]|nr:MAG: hypothetical protein CO128_07690 [Ignavibacteriales bacterium CG_4_9_14_3_um_filter_30_11]
MWIIRIVVFLLLLAGIEFYFLKKVNNSLKSVFGNVSFKKLKLFNIIFFIIFNLFPLYLLLLFSYSIITSNNRLVFPENIFLDVVLVFPFWILLLLMVQSILLFIIVDLFAFVIKLFKKGLRTKVKKYSALISLIIFCFFSIYVPCRILYDYNTIEISNYNFVKSSLPVNLNGFKIVFISDMQADRYTDKNRLNNFVTMVNNEKPDLVLIGGDFITSTPNYITLSAEMAGKIKSKQGVYSCVGDHDNWAYRWDTKRSLKEIEKVLVDKNIKMIDNGNITLAIDSSKIRITFVTNTYVQKINDTVLDSLVDKTNDYELKIFLTHQPSNFLIDKAKKYNYDLYLAGHTHGGQIKFLFPFINLTPTLIETKYVKGMFKFDNLTAIITGGLGMSIAPVRYNSTPQITVIKLVNE